MNFIFNDFKRRFLNGEVPAEDTWTFIPVSDTFKKTFETDDYKLEQYRTLFDFKDVSNHKNKANAQIFNFEGAPTATDGEGKLKYVDVNSDKFRLNGKGLLQGRQVSHIWKKVIDDKSFNVKPMFITKENVDTFKLFYEKSIINNPYIDTYLQSELGGFYFIRSKEELEWFAERSKTNSKIIGVIGDNIDGDIDKPIGPDDSNPFNGILDGNYFAFDIILHAKNSDNGIVGVLGPQGIVRNFRLIHSESNVNRNSIECEIPINLKYLKKDGRDINCGLLVGRNYGIVENINATELRTFNLYGFVPSVYSVTNKSDKYAWNESTNIIRSKFDIQNDNYYFSNSFCINSPGNICPYVGYFAEGKFADDAAAVCLDTYSPNFTITGTISNKNDYFINIHTQTGPDFRIYDVSADVNGFEYNPMGLYLYNDNPQHFKWDFISTSAIENADYYVKSPLYYGLDVSGHWTTRNIGPQIDNRSVDITKSIVCYNANLIKSVYQNHITDITEPSYEMTRCSMRMHPQARAAYNIGTIIGANFGTARNIDVSAIVKNTSNFVGFIGGLIGKQAEGRIDSVNVYMDNQFNYDIGDNPISGGVVYYKQTPIMPPSLSFFVNRMSGLDPSTLYAIQQKYFSAWYDNGAIEDDSPVNTAQNITNDVITYKLKPIFVVGGLFGRYIPSFSIDKNQSDNKIGCGINFANVIYNDNYVDSSVSGIIKSKENAFGSMIGKVDYDVKTNTIKYDSSLTCLNSQFYCSGTGEPFKVYPTDGNGYPIQVKLDETTSACYSEDISKKFVGIYELKNNILDSVVYNAYNKETDYPGQTQKLSVYKIFDYCDYPIDLASHEGGILQTHNLTNFMSANTLASGNGNVYYPMNYIHNDGTLTLAYTGYDHWHQFFNFPNVEHTNTLGEYLGDPAGWNKRNMAIKLIEFANCNSNGISNYIQLYDDYLNTWNINKLPTTATAFNSQSDFYAIGKWWSYYKTNSNGVCMNAPNIIKNEIGWNDTLGTYANYSGWFCYGFNRNCINPYLEQGIQNTFDGYTTVDFNSISTIQYWYDIDTNIADRFLTLNHSTDLNPDFYPAEVNCLNYVTNQTTQEQDLYYTSNRLFTKNILAQYNSSFNTTAIDILQLGTSTTWVNRTVNDEYFYYSYDNEVASSNLIDSNYVPLESAFAFTEKVEYSALYNRMGYYSTCIKEQNNYSGESIDRIEIGQYYTPIEIRSKLNEYKGDDIPTFVTTSISSDDNFAGLLVVDSSGRNVMFYDNENSTQLTGNSVYFPCYKYPKENKKLLLEIE